MEERESERAEKGATPRTKEREREKERKGERKKTLFIYLAGDLPFLGQGVQGALDRGLPEAELGEHVGDALWWRGGEREEGRGRRGSG